MASSSAKPREEGIELAYIDELPSDRDATKLSSTAISTAVPDSIDPNHIESLSDPPLDTTIVRQETAQLSWVVKFKLVSVGFSFFFAGINDGSLGALLPYILRSYHLSSGFVAIIYATTFIGWFTAALLNSHLNIYLPSGAILVAGAALQLICHILRAWLPPFGLYTVTFFLAGLGAAFQDSQGNTFVASVGHGAHRWLGFIHAMYALGCLVSPLIATSVASAVPQKWTYFYLVPVGFGIINLSLVLSAFRDSFRLPARHQTPATDQSSRSTDAFHQIRSVLSLSSVWLLSLFYFFYLGSAFTAGGWVVEYLVQTRHLPVSRVGYIPSGFFAGVFLGRLLLPEPIHRFGERKMLLLLSLFALTFQLIFWLVHSSIYLAAFAFSMIGFFTGPFFVAGMSVGSKLFPKQIQPAALGIVFVVAQGGGSIFPSLTGLIATKAGVGVLQPIMVGLLVVTAGCWMLVPKVPERSE